MAREIDFTQSRARSGISKPPPAVPGRSRGPGLFHIYPDDIAVLAAAVTKPQSVPAPSLTLPGDDVVTVHQASKVAAAHRAIRRPIVEPDLPALLDVHKDIGGLAVLERCRAKRPHPVVEDPPKQITIPALAIIGVIGIILMDVYNRGLEKVDELSYGLF